MPEIKKAQTIILQDDAFSPPLEVTASLLLSLCQLGTF